jgi:hypothetical protein
MAASVPLACEKQAPTDKMQPAAAEREQPKAFEWTEAPTVEQIPAGDITGEASGEPFVVRSVFLEPGFKEWRLVLHEKELKKPTSIRPRGQFISIKLPEAPAAGKVWTREMKYGDGFFQVKKPDDPEKTTSWNAKNAWAIEITNWDVKPYDPKGSIFQEAGRASGRVAVCYKGGGKFKNSWAAGTFKDAVVRYMGKPYWLKEKKTP